MLFAIEARIVIDNGADYKIISAFERRVNVNVHQACQEIAIHVRFRASHLFTVLTNKISLKMLSIPHPVPASDHAARCPGGIDLFQSFVGQRKVAKSSICLYAVPFVELDV